MDINFEGIKEKTLVLIKPDAIQRGLIGEVLKRFEQKGIKIIGIKMITLDEALLREHYAHLTEKPFFPGITKFMSSSPIVAICAEGKSVIEAVRKISGVTKPHEAEAGTIRGDLAMGVPCNVIHASDSIETAMKEVPRFFKSDELFEYNKSEYLHVYAPEE